MSIVLDLVLESWIVLETGSQGDQGKEGIKIIERGELVVFETVLV